MTTSGGPQRVDLFVGGGAASAERTDLARGGSGEPGGAVRVAMQRASDFGEGARLGESAAQVVLLAAILFAAWAWGTAGRARRRTTRAEESALVVVGSRLGMRRQEIRAVAALARGGLGASARTEASVAVRGAALLATRSGFERARAEALRAGRVSNHDAEALERAAARAFG